VLCCQTDDGQSLLPRRTPQTSWHHWSDQADVWRITREAETSSVVFALIGVDATDLDVTKIGILSFTTFHPSSRVRQQIRQAFNRRLAIILAARCAHDEAFEPKTPLRRRGPVDVGLDWTP